MPPGPVRGGLKVAQGEDGIAFDHHSPLVCGERIEFLYGIPHKGLERDVPSTIELDCMTSRRGRRMDGHRLARRYGSDLPPPSLSLLMTLRQIVIRLPVLAAAGLIIFLLHRRFGRLMPNLPTIVLGAAIAVAFAARWWGRCL